MPSALTRGLVRLLPRPVESWLRKAYALNARSGAYDGGMSPESLHVALAQWRIVLDRYGLRRSLAEGRCVDAEGQPIPWLRYPAIEFLDALDFSACRVFEYGSGASTLWWARRAARVDSVEADRGWYERTAARLPANGTVRHAPDVQSYVAEIRRAGVSYHVIVVDGTNEERGRYRCAEAALDMLAPGGMIILDDADFLPEASALLRAADLIEVPFFGLAPLNAAAGCTSVFLRRDFAIPRRPEHRWAIGGVRGRWEGTAAEIVLDGAPN